MSFANRILFATACAGWAATAVLAEPKHGNMASETVKVGKTTREYRLVVPKTVFIAAEGRRLAIRIPWIPVVATLAVGVSLGLPLFLFIRQLKLDGQPAQGLSEGLAQHRT